MAFMAKSSHAVSLSRAFGKNSCNRGYARGYELATYNPIITFVIPVKAGIQCLSMCWSKVAGFPLSRE
jgi:hypothetical protein